MKSAVSIASAVAAKRHIYLAHSITMPGSFGIIAFKILKALQFYKNAFSSFYHN